jgi:hypothetical protein
MLSSGILHHVVLVGTEISEEHIASIIRVIKIGKLGMLAVRSSEMWVVTRVTWCNIPEDSILTVMVCSAQRHESN